MFALAGEILSKGHSTALCDDSSATHTHTHTHITVTDLLFMDSDLYLNILKTDQFIKSRKETLGVEGGEIRKRAWVRKQ